MANIPSIRRSLAPLSNLRKRGQLQFHQIEETNGKKRQVRFTERRFSRDRRNKIIKMKFDRRQTKDRRNKMRFNRSNIHDEATGQIIDTTA